MAAPPPISPPSPPDSPPPRRPPPDPVPIGPGLNAFLSGPPESSTPAQDALRAHVRRFHSRYPNVLRASLVAAAACWLGLLTMVAVAALADPPLFHKIVVFMALTTFSGGQSAAFFAFRQAPPLSVLVVLALTILNMAATLFLIVPLAWRAVEGLRDAPFIGNVLMSAELLAHRRRRFLARWGLAGLAVIAALPVQGAGVLGAGALGVVLRVPLHRLLAVLVAVGAAVNLVWTLLIFYAAAALPSGGLWDLLPWIVVVLLVAVGIAAARMGNKGADHVTVEHFGWLKPEDRERLRVLGITGGAQFLRIDLHRLARRLGIPHSELGRCRSAAGLLRLSSLTPDQAVLLTEVGVSRIRDLAVTPPALVHAALVETAPALAPTPAVARAWHREAKAFVAETRAQRDEAEEAAANVH